MSTELGLAHLSALQLEPPTLVEAAADAGFGSVGVRVHPATPGERRYPMAPGSPMVRATVLRCRDHGITVRDVEVFTLDGVRGREEWLPVLEVGAELGASVLNVIGGDADRHRLRDTLAELVADAAPFGLRPSVEPISYQQVDTVGVAAELASTTGAGVMLDVLHFVRAGSQVEDLQVLPAGTVTVIQLCDGPAGVPVVARPVEMPLGQSTDGSARQVESRARRLAPGAGEFPLAQVLAALPGVPVSVEVPDVAVTGASPTAGAAATRDHLHRLAGAALAVVSPASVLSAPAGVRR